jgi:small subunit ribosomal protein S2e
VCRFKAIVLIGDSEGHIGLGIKTSKEVATAIRAAITITGPQKKDQDQV